MYWSVVAKKINYRLCCCVNLYTFSGIALATPRCTKCMQDIRLTVGVVSSMFLYLYQHPKTTNIFKRKNNKHQATLSHRCIELTHHLPTLTVHRAKALRSQLSRGTNAHLFDVDNGKSCQRCQNKTSDISCEIAWLLCCLNHITSFWSVFLFGRTTLRRDISFIAIVTCLWLNIKAFIIYVKVSSAL